MTGSRRLQSGFTLLEMLIVIVIIITMAAVATPSLVRGIRNYQMESSARQVANTILMTRYEAMRRNRRICTVYQQVGTENRYGVDYNGTCQEPNPTLDAGEPFALTAQGVDWFNNSTPTLPPSFAGLPAGYSDATTTAAPPNYRITFSPRGAVVTPTSPITWVFANRVQMITLRRAVPGTGDVDRILITVSPVGRIKLYRWDFANNQWFEM